MKYKFKIGDKVKIKGLGYHNHDISLIGKIWKINNRYMYKMLGTPLEIYYLNDNNEVWAPENLELVKNYEIKEYIDKIRSK